MKILTIYHPNPPSFPPSDQNPHANPPVQRIKVGLFWVDYEPPGVPTQADVDAFRTPALRVPDARLATATGPVTIVDAARQLEDLKAYLREKLG